jgi:chitinase
MAAGPRSWSVGFDAPALAPILDFINVMTYDFHGPWSDHAGHNSLLALNPGD